jgi:putative tricarboxylic transport membrane protein
MRVNDILIGLIAIAVSIAIIINVQGYPPQAGGRPGPALFPLVLAILLIITGLSLIYQSWGTRHTQPWVQRLPELNARGIGNILLTLGAAFFYVLSSEFLGFLLAAFISMLTFMFVLKAEIKTAVPVAAGAAVAIYLIFNKGLLVPLPRGLLSF